MVHTHIREGSPGLVQHVFWVPGAAPALASTFVSEPQIVPSAGILLHGPLDICLDLLPAARFLLMQKQDAQHMFLQHRGGGHMPNTFGYYFGITFLITQDIRCTGPDSVEVESNFG